MTHSRLSASHCVYTFIQIVHTHCHSQITLTERVTRTERVTHELIELHMQKNSREVLHALPNICEYIFETRYSKVFTKTSCLLC